MISIRKDDGKRTVLFMLLSLASLILSFFHVFSLPVDIAWVAILLCGVPIVKGAVVGLVTELDIKADVLVSIALVASVLIGESFAAGEVALIMTIGAYLEECTVAKAQAGMERLVRMAPTTARVVRAGQMSVIDAKHVQIGDILRVLAGESIAADGIILSGETSVDQSVMTGEPLPVDKAPGDEVRSGTVNCFGTFEMRAERVGEDSALQRMIRLVESADAGKAKIVRAADRWATWIVVIALAAAVITWLVSGEPLRAVTILVVFCPCALVLATPTAIMAGVGNASKRGILVRQGDALERLAKVRYVAFDKTGTLTYGKPAVAAVESCCPEVSGAALLKKVACAELRSEHPLGKAVVEHYVREYGAPPEEPTQFSLLAGRGVQATVAGRTLLAGNEGLFALREILLPEPLVEKAARLRAEGCTVIYVAEDGQAAGLVALSDTLRPDAAQTVRRIHETGVKTLLLTGDAPQAAEHIARLAGIDRVYASCLPEDKLEVIRRLHTQGTPVCMVGDGINDAPALKAAQVGIAMGGIGSDIAIEAADIALVSDEIHQLPHLLGLSGKVMRTIHINLAISMTLNFAAIGLAIPGILNPILGALVHNAGSVAVIIHSAYLLGWHASRRKRSAPEGKKVPIAP